MLVRQIARWLRDEEATANAVLTTAVDTCGRSWTLMGPNTSPGLVRRTVVDSYGPGNPSEKRKVDNSILSLTTTFEQRKCSLSNEARAICSDSSPIFSLIHPKRTVGIPDITAGHRITC